jgi:hypothetical protein
MFQSCLHVTQDDLLPIAREMHLFLTVLQSLVPQVYMHLRSISEDDSISLASKVDIHFCSGNRVGLWLVVK